MTTKRIAVIVGISLVAFAIALTTFFAYKTSTKRPQEPSKPYPYITEEVTFENSQANVTLSGTLTLPAAERTNTAVILISGSGAQNRDEEISGHRPFLVIADHLTKHGIAVLRYDDRGTGKSTGDFKTATIADFAADAGSAVSYLKTRKEIDDDKIGLIGHSEGGIVAPMVASSCENVSFIVLLAGPGIEFKKLLMMQQELIPRVMGASEADIQKSLATWAKALQMILISDDRRKLKADLVKLIENNYYDFPAMLRPAKMSKAEVVAILSDLLSSPYCKNILSYDPAPTLEKVTCPVLALNGEKDLQVTSKENLTGISNALKKGGNATVTVKELPNLNHLFQECATGSPTEYETIEQTFSPIALNELTDWILKQFK